MKQKILLILLSIFFTSYSQKIEKKIGEYKIKKESFFVENRKKISKSEFYFDSSGKILEKIKYGRHHYNKLNIIGEIEQFTYLDEKLESSAKYISSCKTCEYYQYYSLLKYGFDNKLISEKTYRKENDSLFMATEYIYKPNIKEIHFNSSIYYENKYDDENRIIEQNQKYEGNNKTRWKKEFVYSEYNRVSKFQTYYGDGKENSEIEIITYNPERKIISKETVREKHKIKLYYFYNRMGIIDKIEEYESFADNKYELEYVTRFKMNKKNKTIEKTTIDIINSELIGE